MNAWHSVIVVAVIALGLWLWMRSRGGGAESAERRLRRICFGDQAQIDRLIQSELSRAPGISRAEAASRVVARYERDNR